MQQKEQSAMFRRERLASEIKIDRPKRERRSPHGLRLSSHAGFIVSPRAAARRSTATRVCARVVRLPVNDGLDGGIIPADPDVGAHAFDEHSLSALDASPIAPCEGLTVE